MGKHKTPTRITSASDIVPAVNAMLSKAVPAAPEDLVPVTDFYRDLLRGNLDPDGSWQLAVDGMAIPGSDTDLRRACFVTRTYRIKIRTIRDLYGSRASVRRAPPGT